MGNFFIQGKKKIYNGLDLAEVDFFVKLLK